MKSLHLFLRTCFCILFLGAFSFTARTQLPDFTRIDTGAITVIPGGHISSSCFDMDNDGDLDLIIGNSAVYSDRWFSIYKNERNGLYIKIPTFITDLYYKMPSSLGDIDNDGDVDLIAGLPHQTLKTYFNNGYGYFQEHDSFYSNFSSYYPVLIDLDNDGFLDVVGIDRWAGVNYNDGNGGFSEFVNLGFLHDPMNVTLHGVSWGDCDDDGDMDMYGGYSYANPEPGHVSKNACFLNNGDGTLIKFDETSVIVADSTSENPCVNWVDYDNDGDMDLYVVNFTLMTNGPLSALYENLGEMQFTKHVFENEMYRNSFTNSSVWGDLDNDSDLDLLISIENNVYPWSGDTSATPYNLLFLNDGNGSFTNILDHPLTLEDSHTALMFDHDNDGDLDILLTRYSWTNDGHTNLFINEGNDNSWIVLTCEGTVSNRSAIGTRVYAKCFVNGKHITQTREITPINGHLSYANLRVHFGLGDADLIDTLVIRWPSGHVDEYLNVKANQFYRAIEDENLEIDFAATNYIQYSPAIPDAAFGNENQTITIDLSDHYHFIKGDTVPVFVGDTLKFDSVYVQNTAVVTASIDGNILTLVSGVENGESEIQVFVDAGFTKRMDRFTVERMVGIPDIASEFDLTLYPNPGSGIIVVRLSLVDDQRLTLNLFDIHGRKVATVYDGQLPAGSQQIAWDTKDVPPGIYFLRLQAGEKQVTRKLVVLR